METRTCTACKRTLPVDDDHWYFRERGDGIRVPNGARCKRCKLAADARAGRARTPEQKARKAEAEAARKADLRARLGEDEARARAAAAMAEYRARQRAPELLPAVRLVAAELAEGASLEAVALTLARMGVRPPTRGRS